jgi:predicted Zn-dependent protease with MMP-like domain
LLRIPFHRFVRQLVLTHAREALCVSKDIHAPCSSEAEIREQIRLTVIRELGHYVGMDEEQLKDV